jgi:hypothetical protein
MTIETPSPITDLFAAALPGVQIVEAPEPQPRTALVLVGEMSGQYIIVQELVEVGEPVARVCAKHGAQRHNWNGEEYVCKVCAK